MMEIGNVLKCHEDRAPDGGAGVTMSNDFPSDHFLLVGKFEPHEGGGKEVVKGTCGGIEMVTAYEAMHITEAEWCGVII